MQNDEAALKEALERLEAERVRRRDEKIAKGEAVGRIAFVCDEDDPVDLGTDEVCILTVATGVPRGDAPRRPTPAPPPPSAKAHQQGSDPGFWDSKRHAQPLSPAPAPAPPPKPKFSQTERRRIQVETAAPSSSNPEGTIAEYVYQISPNGLLVVTDADGMHVGSCGVELDGDVKAYDAVARRIIGRSRSSESAFWSKTFNWSRPASPLQGRHLRALGRTPRSGALL
jgi:hypothetical protein